MCDTDAHLAQKSEIDREYAKWMDEDIAAELSDENLSKQEVIVKAVKRVEGQIASLEAFVRDTAPGDCPDNERLSKATIGEFLNELPETINDFSGRVFRAVRELGDMLYVRTVRRSHDDDWF